MPFHRPDQPEPLGFRLIGDTIDIAIILLGGSMACLMFANVVSRFVFRFDIAANVELGEFMLVWATFLGGAAAARRGAHMRITELVTRIPPRLARPVEVLTRIGVLYVLYLLVSEGWTIALRNHEQLTTVLYWPVSWTYVAMPVGSALTALFVARETWRIARGGAPASEEH